jgi:hypothetical protein
VSALDDQIRETVNRLFDSLRSQLEADLVSCQDELVRAAHEASVRIATEATHTATSEARREAERQLTEVRESLVRDAENQRVQLTAGVEEIQRRLDDAREDGQRRLDDSERRLVETQRQLEDSQKQLEESQKQSAAASEQIETLTSELEAARQQLDATRDDVEATLRDIEILRRDADALAWEANRLTASLRSKEGQAAQALRLPDAVRALDRSATFGEVLENLAVWAGREAGRAAVFLVKGERLRDWRTVGFDLASDSARLDIEFGDSGPIADAIQSGEPIHPRGGAPLPEFARTGEARDGAAWPVSVGGSVVAVLYADGPVADKAEEPYWPVFLEILARHAGRVLEGITVRQAAGLVTSVSGIPPTSVSRQSTGSFQ